MSESAESRARGAEGLKVYQLALDLEVMVTALLKAFPVRASLRDQLQRAVDSIVLNIAEGAGHYQPGMKIRAYQLAAGSAAEVRAALYLLRRAHPAADVTAAREATNSIGAMLVALIRAQERRRA